MNAMPPDFQERQKEGMRIYWQAKKKEKLDLFHRIALEEYAKAMTEGKESDADYVKQKTYERYEWELKKK